MEGYLPFKNSARAYFLGEASESLQKLVTLAADQYVFDNIHIKDFARFASDEQYADWRSELDEKGVEWQDPKFRELMIFRREDPLTHCFFMRHFLAFGAGLEYLLREQFAADHAKTEKDITDMIQAEFPADNNDSQAT